MLASHPLKGKTVFITGGSRGIGLAIALRVARDGANVVIAAKTSEPHPTLAGTIHTAAAQIRDAGGEALPIAVDIRNEHDVADAVAQTVSRFGGIDVLVNNASALFLAKVPDTPLKRFDLMCEFAPNPRANPIISLTFLRGISMTEEQVALVQRTFTKVKPISTVATQLFYNRLFEIDPSVRAMFKGNMDEQGAKLMQMIGVAVAGLSRPETIVPAVADLGRRCSY